MPAKIRLQRHGKKGSAFYQIVIADGRAPRDGKFIEKIGSYNPTTNPATIILDTDKALTWLNNGAQPTDTCRSILSFKGVMYKKHLQGGVTKGALTQEQADAKFAKWVTDKEEKVAGKLSNLDSAKRDAYKKRISAETAAKEAKAAKIAAKNTPAVEEAEAPAAEAQGEAEVSAEA
jgi:small subunit ribosomal protein S16